MSVRALPTPASVELLDTEAAHMLDALRADDPSVVIRSRRFFPDTAAATIDDARLLLAREYGFVSWENLTRHVIQHPEDNTPGNEQLANTFLDLVVVAYSETDTADAARFEQAADLLAKHPQIAAENIYTAAAIGDTEQVTKWLDEDPSLVNRNGGIFDWEPLMYAAYSRLPNKSTLAAGKLLLARGADSNCHYMWGGQYKFTALTGVFGEGESGPLQQPAHPDCVAFARALLDAGANPNDSQAAYNRMFRDDNTCLELLLEYGISASDKNNWLLHENDKLVPHPDETLHYQLMWAIRHGMQARTKLLIDYGVALNKPDDAFEPLKGRTPYEIAMLYGEHDIAAHLVAKGAEKVGLSERDHFRSLCMAGDVATAKTMLKTNPELMHEMLAADPGLLNHAAGANRLKAVETMITLGADLNQVHNTAPIHQAAWGGHLDMVMLLVKHGADTKIRDLTHHAPPLGWAQHSGNQHVVDYLDECDMDIFTAAARGHIGKVDHYLDSQPDAINMRFSTIRARTETTAPSDWMTPLAFAVMNNQGDMVAHLVERGAARDIVNADGDSLRDLALLNGNDEIARLLS